MSIRTPELATALVEGIAAGTPLRELCRDNGISKSWVYDWIENNDEFAGRIASARARGYDAIAEECLVIADDGTNDYMERKAADGELSIAYDAEHVQRSKLRVETRLKLLAKWDPKRYGDRTVLAGDPEAPLAATVDLSHATVEQLRAIAALKLGEK